MPIGALGDLYRAAIGLGQLRILKGRVAVGTGCVHGHVALAAGICRHLESPGGGLAPGLAENHCTTHSRLGLSYLLGDQRGASLGVNDETILEPTEAHDGLSAAVREVHHRVLHHHLVVLK